jgi:hypothetical protein
MFAQTIRGKVSDPAAVRSTVDRWMSDLGPTATGWLGSTSGVTDDGQLVVLVRFDSEESARANSDKPEQGEWWAEMEKLLDGEATFRDSTDVTVEAGDLDSAGFVQVILGKVTDPERVKELMAPDPAAAEARPDILGSVSVGYDDGGYAYVVYFKSEVEAREGEKKQMPPEMMAAMEEMMSLSVGPQEYLDLKTPWLDSPK